MAIYIIGTIHAGFTPFKELKTILEKLNPNQLLVEIAEVDLKKEKLKNYPPEMVLAYKWAKKNKVKVYGFDSKINELRKGVTKKDTKILIEKQKKLMIGYTWKDMNKKKIMKILSVPLVNKLIDPKILKRRQKEMLRNIKRMIDNKGIVIILTGAGHLSFLEKHFKKAIFPFR